MFSDHFGISLEFEPASLPLRILAYVFDRILLLAFWLLAVTGLYYLVQINAFEKLSFLFVPFAIIENAGVFGQVIYTFFFLLLIIMLYCLFLLPITLFEYLFSGRSPGKLVFGLRIESENGELPTFIQIIIRALLRDIESLTGLVFIAATEYRQTFYDTLAGTVVVQYRQKNSASLCESGAPISGKIVLPVNCRHRMIIWQRKYLIRMTHAPNNAHVRAYLSRISVEDLMRDVPEMESLLSESGSVWKLFQNVGREKQDEHFLCTLCKALDEGRVVWQSL